MPPPLVMLPHLLIPADASVSVPSTEHRSCRRACWCSMAYPQAHAITRARTHTHTHTHTYIHTHTHKHTHTHALLVYQNQSELGMQDQLCHEGQHTLDPTHGHSHDAVNPSVTRAAVAVGEGMKRSCSIEKGNGTANHRIPFWPCPIIDTTATGHL